ncbi:MAG: hypothetical protein AB1489_39215 [Acidobacteriota bacterium]
MSLAIILNSIILADKDRLLLDIRPYPSDHPLRKNGSFNYIILAITGESKGWSFLYRRKKAAIADFSYPINSLKIRLNLPKMIIPTGESQ